MRDYDDLLGDGWDGDAVNPDAPGSGLFALFILLALLGNLAYAVVTFQIG